MDWSPPGSSVYGISQARIVEWVAISFSRGSSPSQGLNPCLLHCRQSLALQLDSLLPPGKPTFGIFCVIIIDIIVYK